MPKKPLSASAKITEVDGGINVDLTCTKCGQPIIGSNKFGMHCKNDCFAKENREAAQKINQMFGGMFSGML
jgi:hypothetical protein